jgi:hypothetical protein
LISISQMENVVDVRGLAGERPWASRAELDRELTASARQKYTKHEMTFELRCKRHLDQNSARHRSLAAQPHERRTGLRLGAKDSMGAGHGSRGSPKSAGFQYLLGSFGGAPLRALASGRPVTKQCISVRNLASNANPLTMR